MSGVVAIANHGVISQFPALSLGVGRKEVITDNLGGFVTITCAVVDDSK
jgi:hypothetical protein